MKKCCFIGHRDSIGLEHRIYAEIKRLMDSGVCEFYSVGMGNFDKMCEKTVKGLGGKIIFVPYNMKQVKEKDKSWYDAIICPFGGRLPNAYSKFDIPERNKYLVKTCDICLCYVYRAGGAMHTFTYAKKLNREIINLY